MLKIKDYGLTWKDAIVDKDTAFRYLRESVILEGRITLQHIAKIMVEYPLLKTFFQQYSICQNIDELIEEMLKNTDDHSLTSLDVDDYGIHGINEEDSYSLSMTPCDEYSDTPVRIMKDMSFLEFLDAIFYDLSFYGSRQECQALVNAMQSDLDDYFKEHNHE